MLGKIYYDWPLSICSLRLVQAEILVSTCAEADALEQNLSEFRHFLNLFSTKNVSMSYILRIV